MPRRKQPPTLRASSLRAVSKLVVDSCEKSDGKQQAEIRRYVQNIPNTFANEYVGQVLRMCSKRRDGFDFTSAFHPNCTVISENGSEAFFTRWPQQILHGFHVMTDLVNIEPRVNLWLPQKDEWEGFQFPRLTNLLSIKVSLGSQPLLLQQVLENCQLLEEISLVFYDAFRVGESCATTSTLMLLSKCKHLKKIFVTFMKPEVAIHLLDHLPNLEVLQMRSHCILKVLPLCKGAYQLKDFVDKLYMRDSGSVQKVVTHFPYLEKLTLVMKDNEHVNMISELANLKCLTLCKGASSSLLFLMDKCMFGLHELDLRNITGLDSLFRENMNVSYPNLTSLTIFNCTGINVAGIREIFPNLKSLELFDGEYMAHDLPCKMPRAGYDALEHLKMTNVPVQQVRCLIPFCNKLKSLKVCNAFVESCVYELLRNADLKALRTLVVRDNSMKREVIPIILDSCGEYLEKVDLHSTELILSPEFHDELSNKLQQYNMNFCVNDSFSYDPAISYLNDGQ